MASFIKLKRSRLDTKPGKSFASIGVFPSFKLRSLAIRNVSSEVTSPRTISINFMTGAGLKKCIPMTRSGLFVAEAIRVMEIEEVLLARITSCRVTSSSFRKISHFRGTFSIAASTTKSQSLKSSIDVVVESLSKNGLLFFSRQSCLSEPVSQDP